MARRLTGVLEPHFDLGSINILEQQPGGGKDLRVARWRPVARDLTEHLTGRGKTADFSEKVSRSSSRSLLVHFKAGCYKGN